MTLSSLFNAKQGRFILVGVFNTTLLYGLYALLIYWGMHYNLALAIDYLIGILIGYYLNRRYTFSNNETVSSKRHFDLVQFQKYLATYLLAFSINLVLLNALVRIALLDPFRAQLLALIITTLCSFLLQDRWVFAKKTDGGES